MSESKVNVRKRESKTESVSVSKKEKEREERRGGRGNMLTIKRNTSVNVNVSDVMMRGRGGKRESVLEQNEIDYVLNVRIVLLWRCLCLFRALTLLLSFLHFIVHSLSLSSLFHFYLYVLTHVCCV